MGEEAGERRSGWSCSYNEERRLDDLELGFPVDHYCVTHVGALPKMLGELLLEREVDSQASITGDSRHFDLLRDLTARRSV